MLPQHNRMLLAIVTAICSACVYEAHGQTVRDSHQGPTSAPAAAATGVVRVGYMFREAWRLGGPGYAQEVFPKEGHNRNIVFIGKMVPRGMLILRSRDVRREDEPEAAVAMRSKGVNLTTQLELVGAQYRKIGQSEVEWVPPERLPKLSVRYEPAIPEEIAFPGKQSCVLLYEIGEGADSEWREGEWVVSLRFRVGDVKIRLEALGDEAVRDPASGPGEAVLYQTRFQAKRVLNEADRANELYYAYLSHKACDDPKLRSTAIVPLTAIIKLYPTEANLLYARAQLLADGKMYVGAIKDLDAVQSLLEREQARTSFVAIPGVTGKDAIATLRSLSKSWAAKAAEAPATQPMED